MDEELIRIGTPPVKPRSRRIPLVAGAVAVLALIGATVAVTVAVTQPEPPAQASPSAAPQTITVTGQLVLGAGSWISLISGGCRPTDGFDDIRSGAQVVVYDAAGTALAIGELGQGYGGGDSHSCAFPFEVKGVPAGHKLYAVEVSHRGKVTFGEADMRRHLELSLG